MALARHRARTPPSTPPPPHPLSPGQFQDRRAVRWFVAKFLTPVLVWLPHPPWRPRPVPPPRPATSLSSRPATPRGAPVLYPCRAPPRPSPGLAPPRPGESLCAERASPPNRRRGPGFQGGGEVGGSRCPPMGCGQGGGWGRWRCMSHKTPCHPSPQKQIGTPAQLREPTRTPLLYSRLVTPSPRKTPEGAKTEEGGENAVIFLWGSRATGAPLSP